MADSSHHGPVRGAGLRSAAMILLGASCFPACFGDDLTTFPPGLEPLEDNTALAPTGAEPFPEVLTIVTGTGPEHAWGHARGFIRRDLKTTWAAMRTPEVSVDRRQVDEWTVDEDTEPEYPFSYVIHNTVRRLIVVRFDVAWRHGVATGDLERPQVVAGRWQKTFGSTVISLLRGSYVAREVAPGVTEIELVQHLSALQGGPTPIESFLGDYFASVRAAAHGEPLPH